MSFVRDQCAIMSRLQLDMAREFASVPPPLSPSPKPEPQDTDSQTLKGCGGFPFVSQRDEE